jgi:hypothetical protein
MRDRWPLIALILGVILLVLGLVLVGHYWSPHHDCGSAHSTITGCSRIKRRFTLGIILAAVGAVALAAAGSERFSRRH